MRRRCTASSFIHSNLFPQLQKIAGTGAGLSCSRSSSPLYCALIKLTHAFAELNPKAPAKEAHTALLQTDCSIAVLDIESGRLHTLCFGRHAHVSQISGVVSERGHILEPVSIREHTVRKTSLFEATYENFHGQQYVVLGSPGLWYAPTVLVALPSCSSCSATVVCFDLWLMLAANAVVGLRCLKHSLAG